MFRQARGISSLLSKVLHTSRHDRIAIIECSGKKFTYGDLDRASGQLASSISQSLSKAPSGKKTKSIACLHEPGAFYVISSLATWRLGAAFVPLSLSHTDRELEYFLADSEADIILTTHSLIGKLPSLSIPIIYLNDQVWDAPISKSIVHGTDNNKDLSALIIYTSGTTGNPKGVVHTYDSFTHMIQSLTKFWEYRASDRILHFLPLHHLHGILNKLWCVLYVGGEVEFLSSARPMEIWKRLADRSRPQITLFMAVPTIYAKLLEAATQTSVEVSSALENMKSIRLMVSGSASLPVPILRKWRDLTGHMLLERYGMTEVGMALSNPLHGERREGYVGTPLPYVECRIERDSEFQEGEEDRECGELLLKGPILFKEYYKRPLETKSSFTSDGWFRTGDIALRELVGELPIYRILGRKSSDIIKSAGYKLSALEIERELLSHPQIQEAVVLGVEDDVYGQIVVAVLVMLPYTPEITLELTRTYLASRLAPYKHPKKIHVVEAISKNQLGKVNKKSLMKDLGVVTSKL